MSSVVERDCPGPGGCDRVIARRRPPARLVPGKRVGVSEEHDRHRQRPHRPGEVAVAKERVDADAVAGDRHQLLADPRIPLHECPQRAPRRRADRGKDEHGAAARRRQLPQDLTGHGGLAGLGRFNRPTLKGTVSRIMPIRGAPGSSPRLLISLRNCRDRSTE